MKKKGFALLAVLLVFSFVLTGCMSKSESAAYDGYKAVEAPAMTEEAVYETADSYGYVANGAYTSDAKQLVGADNAAQESKLVYTAFVSVETVTYDETLQKIRQMTDRFGGYYESSDTSNYGSYRYANYTIRIPSESYQDFINAANEIEMVVSFGENVENVTSNYYDTQSRLEAAQKELESYEALYAQATEMEDILSIKSYISDVQYEIDWLAGTLRTYDALVGYSTINISVCEVGKLRGQEQPAIGFGARVSNGFKTGWRNFVDGAENMVVRFAENFVGWTIFLVILGVIAWLIIRHIIKKRKMRAMDESFVQYHDDTRKEPKNASIVVKTISAEAEKGNK